jgi:putative sterol carrier protein
MTKSEMAARLNEANAYLPGKRVKLDFGDEGVVMLDGIGNAVTETDGDADTSIKVAWSDWQDMAEGRLDGMTAFMQGKLKVEGDMSNAMQLQGVLAKLRS